MADATDDVVRGLLAIFQAYDFNRKIPIVWAENQLIFDDFEMSDDAPVILAHGVYIACFFAIGSQGGVVAVDEQGCSGERSRVHDHCFLMIEFDDDEALPGGVSGYRVRFEALEEGLLELQDLLDMHTHNDCFRGCNIGVNHNYVVELVVVRRENGSALVDFGGVEKVEN